MKVGPVDGSPQEVRDLFENNGLKFEDYLERLSSPFKTKFLIIPILIFFLSLSALAIIPAGSPD